MVSCVWLNHDEANDMLMQARVPSLSLTWMRLLCWPLCGLKHQHSCCTSCAHKHTLSLSVFLSVYNPLMARHHKTAGTAINSLFNITWSLCIAVRLLQGKVNTVAAVILFYIRSSVVFLNTAREQNGSQGPSRNLLHITRRLYLIRNLMVYNVTKRNEPKTHLGVQFVFFKKQILRNLVLKFMFKLIQIGLWSNIH